MDGQTSAGSQFDHYPFASPADPYERLPNDTAFERGAVGRDGDFGQPHSNRSNGLAGHGVSEAARDRLDFGKLRHSFYDPVLDT